MTRFICACHVTYTGDVQQRRITIVCVTIGRFFHSAPRTMESVGQGMTLPSHVQRGDQLGPMANTARACMGGSGGGARAVRANGAHDRHVAVTGQGRRRQWPRTQQGPPAPVQGQGPDVPIFWPPVTMTSYAHGHGEEADRRPVRGAATLEGRRGPVRCTSTCGGLEGGGDRRS